MRERNKTAMTLTQQYQYLKYSIPLILLSKK